MVNPDIKHLESQIEEILSDWKVVGGAASIVKDGQVISCRGYGKKEAGKADLVDENTIFGIGSNTKSFTAAGVALLVDEGKVAWDDPVIKYLPDFTLSDPWVGEHITLRDMLCHRSGLGRSMRILYNHEFDLAEVIRRMRYMPLIKPFRDAFGYNNYHYMTAGRVIEVVSGQSWPQFMRDRLFKPLEMRSSFADLKQLEGQKNISAAHDDIEPGLLPHHARIFTQQQVVPWVDVRNQPAGGISSSAADLTHWMLMLLNDGIYKENGILSPKVIREMTQPSVTFRDPARSELGFLAMMNPEINFYAYGLGWFLFDYKGRLVFFHGGQIHGFNSIVALIPQEKLGYSILTNAHQTYAHAALMTTVADAFLGGSQRNWSKGLLEMAQAMIQGETAALEENTAQRKNNILPALPLEAYTGTYENDFVGKTVVTLKNNQLWMQYSSTFIGPLVHWEAESFHAMWEDRTFDPNLITFHPENGKVNSLTVEPEGKFTRIP